MRSLSSFNCDVKYLLCVIYFSRKYAWVKPLNNKAKKFLYGFVEIVKESKCQQNKLWEGRKCYNSLMPKSIDNNDIFNVFDS